MDRKRNFSRLFAETIRELRIRRGLSQEKCAALAGINLATYRRLEKGQTWRIKWMITMQLAHAFGLKTSARMALMERQQLSGNSG